MPEVLWRPPADVRETTDVGRFLIWLAERGGPVLEDYTALWEWSTTDLAGFWGALWDYFDVQASVPYEFVLDDAAIPDTTWFGGARLNYAEHVLADHGGEVALLTRSPLREPGSVTYEELRDQVARARRGLSELGVGEGDAVAAYLPNIAETVVLFLACASLGAVFCSCAPEFGVRSVVDRFSQIGPTVLAVVDGYRFRDKDIDRRDEVAAMRRALPTVEHVVAVDYLGSGQVPDSVAWADLVADPGPLEFAQVGVDHPLYVLFSSGTTGPPKALIHGHGRILLEHLKVVRFHLDLHAGDVLLQPATTAWMVWNYGVSALLNGATLVCLDGDPLWPDPMQLWRTVSETGATSVNLGAGVLLDAMRSGIRPRDHVDLGALRLVGATGSPLPSEGFRWVYDALGSDLLLASSSGGTDVCTGFTGGSPLLPVTAGEMACRYLGAAVEAFDEQGRPVRGVPGELVITRPMPSMPVGLCGDPDRSRYRASYLDTYPGVWRHGDWIVISDRGTCAITGRSDSTLNRGGVRLGTGEFYSVVEAMPQVKDSLVVHLEDPDGGNGRLVLLVALVDGVALDDDLRLLITRTLRTELSPRHAPDAIHAVTAVPRTLTGKKLELPVKRILLGAEPSAVTSPDAIAGAEGLDQIVELARVLTPA